MDANMIQDTSSWHPIHKASSDLSRDTTEISRTLIHDSTDIKNNDVGTCELDGDILFHDDFDGRDSTHCVDPGFGGSQSFGILEHVHGKVLNKCESKLQVSTHRLNDGPAQVMSVDGTLEDGCETAEDYHLCDDFHNIRVDDLRSSYSRPTSSKFSASMSSIASQACFTEMDLQYMIKLKTRDLELKKDIQTFELSNLREEIAALQEGAAENEHTSVSVQLVIDSSATAGHNLDFAAQKLEKLKMRESDLLSTLSLLQKSLTSLSASAMKLWSNQLQIEALNLTNRDILHEIEEQCQSRKVLLACIQSLHITRVEKVQEIGVAAQANTKPGQAATELLNVCFISMFIFWMCVLSDFPVVKEKLLNFTEHLQEPKATARLRHDKTKKAYISFLCEMGGENDCNLRKLTSGIPLYKSGSCAQRKVFNQLYNRSHKQLQVKII
jgi:hypothetical protein